MSEKRKSIDLNENTKRLKTISYVDQDSESIQSDASDGQIVLTSTPTKPLQNQSTNLDSNNNVEQLIIGPIIDLNYEEESTDELSNECSDQCSNECSNVIDQLNELRENIISSSKENSLKKRNKSNPPNLKEHLLPLAKKDIFYDNDLSFLNTKHVNFKCLINETIDSNRHLFSPGEIEIIEKFKCLRGDEQKLLMLLFLKKDKWIHSEFINYKTETVNSLVSNLIASSFLSSINDLHSLEEALYLLDMKEISKHAIKWKITVDKSKSNLIEDIVYNSKTSKTLFGSSLEQVRLNSVKKDLNDDKFVKLSPKIRKVFLKVLLIQFEPPLEFKDLNTHYTNLIANLNDEDFKTKHFSNYKINITIQIYNKPLDLDYYADACLTELKLNENGFCDTDCLISILNSYEDYVKSNLLQDKHLLNYLLRFTAGHKLVKCLELCVKLIKDSMIKESVHDFSIKQQFYGLRSQEECVINNEISIIRSTVTIEDDKDRKKDKFKLLEELGIGRYGEETTTKSMFRSLFISLLCGPLFADVENVFRFSNQQFPLDLNTSSFYSNRMDLIDIKLDQLENLKINEIRKLVENAHKQFKFLRSLTHLSKKEFDTAKDLILLIKKSNLIQIIRHLLDNFQVGEDTNPSVIQINLDEREVKFIEVKAREDELSANKIKWLNFLHSLGLNVEIYDIKLKYD